MDKKYYNIVECRRNDGRAIYYYHVFTDESAAVEFCKELGQGLETINVNIRGWQIDHEYFNDFFTDRNEALTYCQKYGLIRADCFRSMLQPATRCYKFRGWPNTGVIKDINNTGVIINFNNAGGLVIDNNKTNYIIINHN